jgi:hypothetical protein
MVPAQRQARAERQVVVAVVVPGAQQHTCEGNDPVKAKAGSNPI